MLSDMAAEKRFKKDKEISLEFDNQMKDIRQQLSEQLKCLDVRLESHMAMLWELQEFYKKRAELELEYSRSLDKLVKNTMMRHKAEKQKRELWPGYSTYKAWQTLLASTKRCSQDHASLNDIYTSQMVPKFGDLVDDTQRIFKKCKDIALGVHEELLKVLNELHSAMKTYHLYHGESKMAESKLRDTEMQKSKVEQQSSKSTVRREVKNLEKKREKRQAKYLESKKKALKARNEYLLGIDVANIAIQKYFVDDMPDLIDCMDVGYHTTITRAMKMHMSADDNVIKAQSSCVDLMRKCVSDLDQRTDKQRFLELYNQAFSLPKKFDFQAHKGDEVCQISAQKTVQDELIDRLNLLNGRLKEKRLNNDEMWKTLETAEKSLMNMINHKDYDVSSKFVEEGPQPPKSPHEVLKKRSDRLETEAFYIDKFHEYLVCNNLIARLQARFNSIQKALGEGNTVVGASGQLILARRPPSLPPKPNKKRRIGKSPLVGTPKLFGGSIEEYVEATGHDIPLPVRSCIRLINIHGLHHQGVFRVSGSQHEITDYKAAFEKGEDPNLDQLDNKDINSVAGVLKLYFRELREPLLPTQMFDSIIACARIECPNECIARLKELILPLSRPVIIVMRYLFAFLNHLSEYSDENMMDAYNLAVCFGPTLLPIPPDRDQVAYSTNVNEVIKTIIVHQEEIFPHDGGEVYEKCIVERDDERDDSLDNLSDDDDEVTDAASEEEPEVLEALAQYDFTGRTDRELTFKKGDVLLAFNQVSTDWWEGALNGKEGLIPDKYIHLRTREKADEKSSTGEEDKRRSTESLPAKPFSLSSSGSDDTLDKASSQPNIAVPPSSHSHLGLSRSTQQQPPQQPPQQPQQQGQGQPQPPSLGSTPSELSKSEYDLVSDVSSTQSLPDSIARDNDADSVSESLTNLSTGTASTMVESTSGDSDRSTEDLAQDIDSALAEVMSGLQSLEMQQKTEKGPMSAIQQFKLHKPPSAHPKHTPDLVLDLPISAEPPSPKGRTEGDSPTLSSAELFADSNQCTIKKGASLSMPRNLPSSAMHTYGGPGVDTSGNGQVHGMIDTTLPSEGISTFLSIKRGKSSKVHTRTNRAASPARTIDRYSDPSSQSTVEQVPASALVKSSTLPAQTNIPERSRTPERTLLPDRPSTPVRLASLNRPTTPETNSQAQAKAAVDEERSTQSPSPLSRVTPDRAEKPKPPLKSKPPVMKKPARSPEILKRLREAQDGGPPS